MSRACIRKDLGLDRIFGIRIHEADELCAAPHLHAMDGEGILIDDSGPYADPQPFGCGFGVVEE